MTGNIHQISDGHFHKTISLLTVYILTFSLLSIFYIKMLLSYIKNWLRTSEVFTNFEQEDTLQISIIVAARNEENSISKCLTHLTEQNYNPNLFEIILIDDFSDDETLKIASNFKNVKVLALENILDSSFKNLPNKKRAIRHGIENAKNEIIITADADCFYQKNWLKAMAQSYLKTNAKLITAPVLFVQERKPFNSFLTLDLISLIGITAASIKNKKPSMVNGANLLFEKNTFLELRAFEGNEHVASGDDVFLMQKINKTYPDSIVFLKNLDAATYTYAPATFSEFINQRIRWTSKSSRYADKEVVRTLTLNYLFYFFMLLGFVLSFSQTKILFLVLPVFLIKLILDIIFFQNLLSFFRRKDLLKSILIVEVLHLIYINILGILSLIGKYTWKGRQV